MTTPAVYRCPRRHCRRRSFDATTWARIGPVSKRKKRKEMNFSAFSRCGVRCPAASLGDLPRATSSAGLGSRLLPGFSGETCNSASMGRRFHAQGTQFPPKRTTETIGPGGRVPTPVCPPNRDSDTFLRLLYQSSRQLLPAPRHRIPSTTSGITGYLVVRALHCISHPLPSTSTP